MSVDRKRHVLVESLQGCSKRMKGDWAAHQNARGDALVQGVAALLYAMWE